MCWFGSEDLAFMAVLLTYLTLKQPLIGFFGKLWIIWHFRMCGSPERLVFMAHDTSNILYIVLIYLSALFYIVKDTSAAVSFLCLNQTRPKRTENVQKVLTTMFVLLFYVIFVVVRFLFVLWREENKGFEIKERKSIMGSEVFVQGKTDNLRTAQRMDLMETSSSQTATYSHWHTE